MMKNKIINILLCAGIILCIVLLFIAKQNQWILVAGIVAGVVVLVKRLIKQKQEVNTTGQDRKVYVTETGKVYHSKKVCGSITCTKGFAQAKAIKKGYEKCSKCWH